MNVALYCRNIKPHDIPVLQHVLDLLAENKIGVFIFKPFFESVWATIKTRSGISTFETHADIRDKANITCNTQCPILEPSICHIIRLRLHKSTYI